MFFVYIENAYTICLCACASVHENGCIASGCMKYVYANCVPVH